MLELLFAIEWSHLEVEGQVEEYGGTQWADIHRAWVNNGRPTGNVRGFIVGQVRQVGFVGAMYSTWFYAAWRELEEDSRVDSHGGCQCRRIATAWEQDGRPRDDVRAYILARTMDQAPTLTDR